MSSDKQVTSRGFRVYAEIEDSHGNRLRVQQSSAYGGKHVWLFSTAPEGHSVMHWKDGGGGGWEPAPKVQEAPPGKPSPEHWQSISPHLSLDEVRTLIAALQQHLIESGEAPA